MAGKPRGNPVTGMNRHANELCRLLEACDVAGIMRLHAHVFPHLPQPAGEHEALVSIHYARTQMPTMALRLRAYSHRWLLDNGYPSGLPDELKPSAERMYPVAARVVGISVNSKYPVVERAIQGAMESAVFETYADGHEHQPEIVRARMMEARERERRGLGL